ncbi:hypothetical protein V6N11_043446 [Hibiscus sabdariffa]|uniref:Uncharacterized protein n=1 Tax=Hibiscus sabdariffa TaxID=183260 RepID=A0ABR2RCJ6_9ROSI
MVGFQTCKKWLTDFSFILYRRPGIEIGFWRDNWSCLTSRQSWNDDLKVNDVVSSDGSWNSTVSTDTSKEIAEKAEPRKHGHQITIVLVS